MRRTLLLLPLAALLAGCGGGFKHDVAKENAAARDEFRAQCAMELAPGLLPGGRWENDPDGFDRAHTRCVAAGMRLFERWKVARPGEYEDWARSL